MESAACRMSSPATSLLIGLVPPLCIPPPLAYHGVDSPSRIPPSTHAPYSPTPNGRVTLIEAKELLGSFDASLREYAARKLTRQGIKLRKVRALAGRGFGGTPDGMRRGAQGCARRHGGAGPGGIFGVAEPLRSAASGRLDFRSSANKSD